MKKAICILLSVMMIISLAGCSSSKDTSKGELNIFIWTEYVPESVIKDFEKETGITVNISTYSSNEDMISKVKSETEGAYDIVQPSDYMVEQMISQGMLQELDRDKLTNFENIAEAYLDPSYDPGNVYSVPYLGGAGAIAVNTDVITDEIISYADLFKPEYKDSLVVLDDFRAVIGIAAKSMGYSMSETDPAILEEVKEQVLSLKNNIKLYDSDSPKSALISGDCSLAFCWSAEIALAMEENPAIEIVYPSEGPFLFLDNWCVTKGAKNYDNAMLFIDYMLKAETGKTAVEEFPYLNTNEAALALLGDDFINNPAKNPPADALKNGEYIKNISTDVISIYDEIWTELKK